MRNIPPPNLLLNFYSAQQTPLELFSRIAHELPVWEAPRAWRIIGREDERAQTFTSLAEGLHWSSSITDEEMAEVDIDDLTQPSIGSPACLSFFDYSTNPPTDRVVRIINGGADFTPGGDEKFALKQGLRAAELLIALSSAAMPSYASVTVEYEMETPSELSSDPSSYAFQNCFLREADFGSKKLERLVKGLLSEAFVRMTGDGLYFSTSRYFNPERIDLGSKGSWLSSDVAVLISDVLNHRS